MKLSLNWLKEYVDLPENLTPEQIAYDLTMTTVEVEGFEAQAESLAGLIVGEVATLRPHPNADRLRVVMTKVGVETKQIVCGGSNLREGMLVAVAPPGAKVRWHGEGELVELKETKLRGEASWGMICASDEIGLSDLFPAKQEKEIVDLTLLKATPGMALAEALGLNDTIIEIDNKSLTNRPDLWGHYGIARELAAIYGRTLKPLQRIDLPKNSSGLRATIDHDRLCRRYTATVIDGLKTGDSPLWMQRRLASVGQRPISLAVDLTNYVMLAVGQPTHAFDARELAGNTIRIRQAKVGEQLELLDSSVIELSSEMLVIADDRAPVALAGIMGGKNSGVRNDTTRLVLESGNFDAVSVRRTATKLGVRTESSMRFDKSLDCERVIHAVHLFVALLKEIQPNVSVTSFLDLYPRPFEPVEISVERTFISQRVGKEFTAQEISVLLERLGYTVRLDKELLHVTVPPYRATGDVSLQADLVEEVARLYGYDKLEFLPPPVLLTSAVRQPRYDLDKGVREFLARSAGMNEVFNYPWVDSRLLNATGLTLPAFELQDPPSPELATVVRSLVPNLLANVEKNIRNETQFGIFEVARVFEPNTELKWGTSHEILPRQPKLVAGALVGGEQREVFLRLKGVLSGLFASLPIDPVIFQTTGEFSPWSKGAQLSITTRGRGIGEIGLVGAKTLRALGLDRVSVAVFEFNFDSLIDLPATKVQYEPIPKFPLVKFDLSMLFDLHTPWEKISASVSAADKRVWQVRFVDEYIGEQIPSGKRSVSLEMIFADREKTLTSEETQEIANRVMSSLEKRVRAARRER